MERIKFDKFFSIKDIEKLEKLPIPIFRAKRRRRKIYAKKREN